MKQFNVLIEDNDKFKPYDIMRYLINTWEEFQLTAKEIEEGDEEYPYWKIPVTFKEFYNWVDSKLKYQYWARCEYEMVLSPWPPYTNENDEMILKNDKCKKIDIYDQCKMNLDLIVEIFLKNIGKNSVCENS